MKERYRFVSAVYLILVIIFELRSSLKTAS